MEKFPYETFLELWKGSHRKANPLIKYAWVSDPITKVEKVERKRSLYLPYLIAYWKSGVLRLLFDSGIINEISGIVRSLKDRNRSCGKPCQFGFGGQSAFYHYLNYFTEFSSFRFQYDSVFSSKYSLPFDFRLFFPDHNFTVEIKTSLPNMKTCNYYKSVKDPNPYPDYCVSIKALDESMRFYEVYGYCSGLDVQKVNPTLNRRGYLVHPIPLNRKHFIDYAAFHQEVLDLPFGKFNTEHYIKQSG